MLIERPALDALLPHAEEMCLLDGVVAWDITTIHCVTRSHCRLDNPLRSCEGLSALCGVEYGAQAMAIHSALLNSDNAGPARNGVLVSVRNLVLQGQWLHNATGPLDVMGVLEVEDGRCLVHRFWIEDDGRPLVAGRLMVLRTRERLWENEH